MEKINSHKHQAAAAAATRSPHLLRCRSGSPVISLPESSHVSLNRARSTGKQLKDSCKAEQEKWNPVNNTRKEALQDDSAKCLQRNRGKIEAPRKARFASTSPSAWALSPGRTPLPLPVAAAQPVQVPPVPKSPVTSGKLKRELCSKGKGVSGVLNYFQGQKKISPIQEKEYYQFCIMHNILLQWRFANARAEVSMMAVKRNAEKKLFNVWARIAIIRKLVAEKGIQMQKLKQESKISQIVGSQICLLKEWGRLENKNFEAVGRLARKLSAISSCLPLVKGAKVDVIPLHDTMCMAVRVMESIEAMIMPIQSQVNQMNLEITVTYMEYMSSKMHTCFFKSLAEGICYLITELSIKLKVEIDLAKKLAKLLATVASLEAAEESSLKVHCAQLIS